MVYMTRTYRSQGLLHEIGEQYQRAQYVWPENASRYLTAVQRRP